MKLGNFIKVQLPNKLQPQQAVNLLFFFFYLFIIVLMFFVSEKSIQASNGLSSVASSSQVSGCVL